MAVTSSGLGEFFFPNLINGAEPHQHKTIHSITKVNNGFIAEVGCQKFTFHTVKELTEAITLFYTDYEKAKEKYLEK